VAVDHSEFNPAWLSGATVKPQARLTLHGSGFTRHSRVEVTTTDGTVHAAAEPRFVSDARLEVAIGSDDDVTHVRVINADGADARWPDGNGASDPGGTQLTLRRARPVQGQVWATDPAHPTAQIHRATVRRYLSITLFGSGFDDKTNVHLWSGADETIADHVVALSDGVLEATVEDYTGQRLTRIRASQPDGRFEELILDEDGPPHEVAAAQAQEAIAEDAPKASAEEVTDEPAEVTQSTPTEASNTQPLATNDRPSAGAAGGRTSRPSASKSTSKKDK